MGIASGVTLMSQLHLTDEILMAFADGELDEAVASAVAKAMAEIPASPGGSWSSSKAAA
jgi:hypothetical protein